MSAKVQDWDNIPGFNRAEEQYVGLDLGKWLKDHNVESEGRNRGQADQPAASDDNLDAFESQIVDWVNRRARVCRANVGGHLSDLERDLADMENDAELTVLGDEADELKRRAETALEHCLDAGRTNLTDPEDAVRNGCQEFERFRGRARLTRLADYSHRSKALWWIFGCAAIEVVLNASLFMDVNPFGLLGSTMQMTLISAVNVVVAGLAMAVLLRQSHHVSPARKAVSWCGMVLVIVMVLGFNLAVGHFRNSLQATLDDRSADVLAMGNDVLERLLEGPLDLASFQTALLVLLGIACFGIGAWKWFQRDDAYPGYGRLKRQLDGIKAAYVAAYEAAQEELRETHDSLSEKLNDMRHQLIVKQSKWREICKRGENVVADFPTNLSQYQLDLNFLLAAYRTANRGARSEPPPPHFDQEVSLDESVLEPPRFRPPRETSIKEVAEKMHGAIDHLQEIYRVARRKYRTLEAVIEKGVAQTSERQA